MSSYEAARFIIPTHWVVDHEGSAVEIVSVILGKDSFTPILSAISVSRELDDAIVESAATGISKRTVPDKHDANLGYDLAYWRAVKKMADKQLSLLDGQIRDHDFQREHAEKIKAEKVEAAAAKKSKKKK